MEKYKFYSKRKQIGSGTYGKVYLVKDHSSKSKVMKALKEYIKQQKTDLCATSQSTIREISILMELKEINHPNIIEFERVVPSSSNLVSALFNYEPHDLGELTRKYSSKCDGIGIPLAYVKSFTKQLLSAIDFIHGLRICHRDLKPSNILVNHNGWLKIADFGLAKSISIPGRTLSDDVVTLWYRAPEIMLGRKSYNHMIDIWSIGCIYIGDILFQGDSEIDQIFKIFQLLGTPSYIDTEEYVDICPEFPKFRGKTDPFEAITHQVDNLLMSMLKIKPDDRLEARSLLKCDLVNNARIINLERLKARSYN